MRYHSGMLKSDAVQHFGSQQKLAEALGVKQPSVARWPEVLPPLRQLQIENVTNGALKATEEARAILRPQPKGTQ